MHIDLDCGLVQDNPSCKIRRCIEPVLVAIMLSLLDDDMDHQLSAPVGT